ncbi:lysoplasmalogenase [Hyalangium gracile]|uniref:lysoplasmalogenase n=1 Tax=Hyalangium gracile TaxID=394092 RepID=UPI001CCD7EE4|nr:lysoplasmalogenase [Hyalangium gracile]
MSSDAPDSSLTKSPAGFLYVLLIAATAVNLTANLIADVTLFRLDATLCPPDVTMCHPDLTPCHPEQAQPAGWVSWLIRISKPMLVPALAGILFLSTRGVASTIRRGSFYVALLFCWVGDIALLISTAVPSTEPDYFFFVGLGAFGVAHLFFIWSYAPRDKQELRWMSFVYGLPFVVYGYTLYSVIYHSLVEPKQHATVQALSIAGYMVVLLSNGVTALLRLRANTQIRESSASILAGVVLFVQSDSIIAITRYVSVMPLERFSIMATYILGLYLMVRGCFLEPREGQLSRPTAQPEARPETPPTMQAAA